MEIYIYRGLSVWITLKVDDNTRLISQLLGECIIKASFNSHIFLDIDIGDWTVYDGIIYYVNSLPNIKKNSINSFDYDVTFESESYELLKTQFLDTDGNSDFHLMGDLETFIDLIITNMDREHTGWVKGTCDQTNADYKLLSFSKANCMQVLQKLCKEFEGEYYFEFSFDFVEGARLPYVSADSAVVGYRPAVEAEHVYRPAEASITNYTKDICFTDKAGRTDLELTFLYKQGLRNIHRTTLSEKNIVTRIYAFGSKKNLASDYRSHSLRLKFVAAGESYLESNVDKYGTIEHTEIFKDIYPHRDGTISAVDGADITKFTDNGMDFNLNDYLLPGVTAKIHFNTGNLAGYEFEISSYNNGTKEFTIIAFKDNQGYEMPNATLKPAVSDTYVLIDIEMPQGYIDTAETALEAKAQAYLDDNDEPRVTYIIEPDPRYFETHTISLLAGDFITIEDTTLGIDVLTRVVELTKSIANEYKYTLKLTDHLEVQLIERLYSGQENIKEIIEIGEGGDAIRARRDWKTSEELRTMIFDTDGYFDMGNIRPLSVTTGMLSVGSKSTQFILEGILAQGNYTGDKTKFHASAGSLIHLTIADEIRTWTLSENSQDSLVDETAYYIYAKCTKDPGYTGQVVVDDTQREFDDDATYYYFLIGVLHSVVDGIRGISLTYGQTIINGGFIQANSITADKYNELRNTFIFNGDDSLDGSFPFELDFEIVSEMTAIESIKLSFRISEFRSYTKAGAAQGTPSGGGATTESKSTPSGGGATSDADGAQTSSNNTAHSVAIPVQNGTTGQNITYSAGYLYCTGGGTVPSVVAPHTHDISDHTHDTPDHTHPSHNHSTPDHTHPNHSHTAVYGIFEDNTSPTIHYHIDNGEGYGDPSGNFVADQLDIDITEEITGAGFKKIKFESTTRARIRAWVLCKIDLSA